jgi:hypothetical protein
LLNELKDTKLEVLITMSRVDFEAVLLKTDMGVKKVNTFLTVAAGAIEDTATNQNAATTAGAALNVAVFGAVQEAELDKFDLDMDQATLTLSFTGVVDVATFNAEFITLQNAANVGTSTHTLSDKSALAAGSQSGFVVVVDLHKDDQDALKAARQLVTGTTDTYVAIAPSFPLNYAALGLGLGLAPMAVGRQYYSTSSSFFRWKPF